MFKSFAVAFFVVFVPALPAPPALEPPVEREIANVLDAFHAAASNADFEAYFGAFASGAVFLGTDATERWTVDEFKTFAKPHFDRGTGWTYVAVERHVTVGVDGEAAWFDELLQNAKYGKCRGSGVLLATNDGWKIAQYNLTFVVPNDVALDVVDVIRKHAE